MKTVFAALLALTMSFTGFAQGQSQGAQGTPEERAQKMTDRMKTELSLTDAQVKQVYDINLKTAQKRAEMQQMNQEKRTALRDEHQAALAKVLTPEQQEKAKQLRAERKGNYKHGKGKHHHGCCE